ncbi:MAG: ribosome-associated translation inhibitor RaiA [Spirochaetes bacterium]|nr:MAG: ribosome-associated translation inhibitor RaiA [Spirochaetota bacterium]
MDNIEIKGVHFNVSDDAKEYIHKKLHRIDYASDLIVDLLFTLTKEKKGYTLVANINFRWGYSTHIEVKNFDLFEGIDKLMDKLELKVTKEKEKIQEHT